MKKLPLLLLLLSAGVQAQTNYITIGRDTIPTLQYVKKLVGGGSVGPVLDDCKAGPTLKEISNISSVYLNFLFDGEKVYGIDWTIQDAAGNVKRSGNVAPQNNRPGITFAALEKGTYYLVITGSTCKSKLSSKLFLVPGESGGITPPDPIEDGTLPKFSQTPHPLMKIKNVGGVYTDETPGDYIGPDKLRYRVENGITYRALYWLTELPLFDTINKIPVDFGSRVFANGLTPSIRKEYAAAEWDVSTELKNVSPPWRGAKNQEDFKNAGWDTWLHGFPPENPNAQSGYLFKSVVSNLTTNGGHDLKTGDGFVREQIPGWLDAGNLIPQFMFNPSLYKTDRAISIQNWPGWTDPYETAKRLYDGGITHAWWEAMHGAGIYKDGVQAAGLPKYKIKPAFNWSSTLINYANPELQPYQQATPEQYLKTARFLSYPDSSEFTDEMSEGSFPQVDRTILYADIASVIAERGAKGTHLYGDYGYGSINLVWNSSKGRDPMNPYYLALLGPDGWQKLEQVGGSGHTGLKNQYFDSGQYKTRGTVIGSYYAITHLTPDRTPSMGFEAIGLNNMAPDQPRIRFSTVIMQSNANGTDVPYKSDGIIKANGVINTGQYPETPAELLKHDAFFSCLYYKGAYLWDAIGIINHEDVNSFYNSSITTDAWVYGTRMYAKLIPYLNQANRDIVCTDFTTSGTRFNFKTKERKISNSGRVYYFNQYFNEVVDGKTGMLLHIPASKKAFIWLNSYKRADEVESVTAHIDGKDYYLGEAAGSTLTVFYEK